MTATTKIGTATAKETATETAKEIDVTETAETRVSGTSKSFYNQLTANSCVGRPRRGGGGGGDHWEPDSRNGEVGVFYCQFY
jgi:hypothetical protein